jgi:pimeloyl-ACP methyl ester carboxylesterase
MDSLVIRTGDCTARAPRVVLLTGAYHANVDFVRAGFDQALRDRALAAELILVAPALEHLQDRDWIERLRTQVMAPARARARGDLWLGGVSLGGFMALRYALQRPEGIDGLCLLAPYLGSRIIAAEAARQLPEPLWQSQNLADDDDERRVWRYARELGAGIARHAVYCGLSSEDRFADTQGLLRALLGPERTQVIAGRHDWPAWRALWDNFLDRHLAGVAAARPA